MRGIKMIKIYQEDLETMKRIVADYTEQVVDFEIEAKVQAIITQVRKRGDQALIDYLNFTMVAPLPP